MRDESIGPITINYSSAGSSAGQGYRNRYNLIDCTHKKNNSCVFKKKVPDQTENTILLDMGAVEIHETFVCFTKITDASWSLNKIIPFSIALAPETEEEEDDPLSFIQIKSAAQWMAVSKRISWNFEETETEEAVKEEPFTAAKGQEISEGNFNVIDFQKKNKKR